MARALRVEYRGAVHHVTARGNARRNIFRSDADRRMFLEFLATATRRFGWLVTANYRDFVAEKIDSTECLWDQAMNQIYLGGERWALNSIPNRATWTENRSCDPKAR